MQYHFRNTESEPEVQVEMTSSFGFFSPVGARRFISATKILFAIYHRGAQTWFWWFCEEIMQRPSKSIRSWLSGLKTSRGNVKKSWFRTVVYPQEDKVGLGRCQVPLPTQRRSVQHVKNWKKACRHEYDIIVSFTYFHCDLKWENHQNASSSSDTWNCCILVLVIDVHSQKVDKLTYLIFGKTNLTLWWLANVLQS